MSNPNACKFNTHTQLISLRDSVTTHTHHHPKHIGAKKPFFEFCLATRLLLVHALGISPHPSPNRALPQSHLPALLNEPCLCCVCVCTGVCNFLFLSLPPDPTLSDPTLSDPTIPSHPICFPTFNSQFPVVRRQRSGSTNGRRLVVVVVVPTLSTLAPATQKTSLSPYLVSPSP